jgi:hypothetical protein
MQEAREEVSSTLTFNDNEHLTENLMRTTQFIELTSYMPGIMLRCHGANKVYVRSVLERDQD